MKLDTLILGAVVLGALLWATVMLMGLIAAWPVGLIGLAIYAAAAYVIYRVVAERLRNVEDDYYYDVHLCTGCFYNSRKQIQS